MRPRLSLLAVSLVALTLGSTNRAGETTRTLRIEYTAAPGTKFLVENLAGTMKVVPGSTGKVVAVATVHAESQELANLIKFEQVVSEKGEPALRVVYPVDRYTRYRLPASHGHGSEGGWASFLGGLFGSSSMSTEYAGRKVKVSSGDGVMVFADVQVDIPANGLSARLRNVAGPLSGEGIDGKLEFDTANGDITLSRMTGEIAADSGSGDVKASDLSGSFSCDVGSGDCDLTGFDGDSVTCDTGSGDVRVRSAHARRLTLDTGSGDIEAADVDIEEFDADTGSGDVELAAVGARVTRIQADTGSGSVTLRLPSNASFEALADQGSGDMRVAFSDAEPIRHKSEIVGYRRGDGKIRITVETGSGDLKIEPGL